MTVRSVYACPCCRAWQQVSTPQIRARVKTRGACIQCIGSGFFRLKCHIAAIEDNLDRIVEKGKTAEGHQRDRYRFLWQKRRRQLHGAKALLAAVQ